MPFTMKDVTELSLLHKAVVRSGSSALFMRPVESVSVIEMPVEDFVRQNEFVLTTAIGCSGDLPTFATFVQDIIDSKAAGLAIAVGRYVHDIPAEIIALAEAHAFPIIELPWEIRFADVTQELLQLIHNQYKIVLHRTEAMQKKLLTQFLGGADLHQAANTIQQVLSRPVLIVNHDGTVKGKSSKAQSLAKWWKLGQHSATSVPHPLTNLTDIEFVTHGPGACYKLPIQSTNKIQGYLLISLPGESSPEAFWENGNEQVVEHALTATALWFQREKTVQETELRLRDDFVWNLAKGEIDSWETVLSRAKSLRYNVNLPYICIVGVIENLDVVYAGQRAEQETFELWTASAIKKVEDQVIQSGQSLQCATMLTYQNGQLIIYLEAPKTQASPIATTFAFLDHLEHRLAGLLSGLVLSWGIAEHQAGVNTFAQGYHDAQLALEIGSRLKGTGHRSTHASTGMYRVLRSVGSHPEMQELAQATVGVLMDYDRQRGLELFNTLTTFIGNQGNVSQTSRALNLHRQSLLYRLRKIESLTGRSLVDPDDLFLLTLSVKLWTTGVLQSKKT